MSDVRVFLIGGAPGIGKTTLGCALASRLGFSSVTVDDLVTVARTVTTPESHPGLHAVSSIPHLEYIRIRPSPSSRRTRMPSTKPHGRS